MKYIITILTLFLTTLLYAETDSEIQYIRNLYYATEANSALTQSYSEQKGEDYFIIYYDEKKDEIAKIKCIAGVEFTTYYLNNSKLYFAFYTYEKDEYRYYYNRSDSLIRLLGPDTKEITKEMDQYENASEQILMEYERVKKIISPLSRDYLTNSSIDAINAQCRFINEYSSEQEIPQLEEHYDGEPDPIPDYVKEFRIDKKLRCYFVQSETDGATTPIVKDTVFFNEQGDTIKTVSDVMLIGPYDENGNGETNIEQWTDRKYYYEGSIFHTEKISDEE